MASQAVVQVDNNGQLIRDKMLIEEDNRSLLVEMLIELVNIKKVS